MSWIEFQYQPPGSQRRYCFAAQYCQASDQNLVEIADIKLLQIIDIYPGKPEGILNSREEVVFYQKASPATQTLWLAIENWLWAELQQPHDELWDDLLAVCLEDLETRQPPRRWQCALQGYRDRAG